MEKPRRPILTAPSKISSLSKSSSFTKQQTTTGSSDSTTRRVMSPLTKSILLKSSSTPDAQTCLMSRSNLELSIEKDQYQKEKNGSTTDSNSQPETPTRTLPSFQIGLSPVRKLSYTSKTNNVRNINENGLNASESKGDNLSEPSEEKFVSASLQEDNSSTSNNRDNHLESSNKILTNSVKRDNLSASLKSLRETEESVTSVTSQSRLKDTLESQNSNITNARTGYGDEKSVTCDGEHLNFDEKMANSLQSIDIPDYVSDGSDKTQKTTERLLVENKNNKTIINGPFNVSLTTPQTTTNTPDNIDSDSETADDMSLSQGTCEAPEKSSKLSQGTSETAEKSSKLSQGTSETAVKTSELQERTSKTADETLESQQGTSKTAVETLESLQGTSKTADKTSESQQGTSKTAVKTLESSQETSKTAVETLESQHGTSKTVFETSKLSQGTHASSHGTTESSKRSNTSTRTPETLQESFVAGEELKTLDNLVKPPELLAGKLSDTVVEKTETFMRTPETSHNCSDNTETSHNCSDNMETSHSDNTEASHNCSDNTETSHNCSDNMETSHNCSDNGNQIVFESARKEVLEKSDVCDVVDSKTHRKSPWASNKNAHTKTTYEDVDHQKGSTRPSVERGRTHDIISSNDDTTGQQSTASFQVQPDTKNKRVRSQSPGWNFFSRSRVNSKGSNIPSKLRSLFSPKDKDKEKSPKMSPKFKPKNFKLFRKSDDVTQIWEIYDIDTPDGTNDTQTDVLGLSNQMQLSETRGTHPDISASGLQNQVRPSETRGIHPDISALGLQNQVQPSSDKIILPVTSKPTILSPSEAEQSLNVNKNPTVQTPINSVVLETDIYSHTHKNGTVTSAGSEITSDSLNLCKDTSKSPSDENFRELESNISAKRAENNSIYEDVVPSIVSPEIGKSDSLLEMINMKFDKENKQNLIPDSLLIQNNDTNVVLDNDAPKPPVRRHSAKTQAIQLTTVSSMTPSGNSSQEQENEQVSYLSSGSNTQTPTQHQTSNGSRLSTQNDVDTASGIKYEMSQNSSSTKLSVPCLNVNASLLENNVKDVETSPPPIPSPRRRLRRRFSLGPRKLDEDEFIGFASLPEQVHRKAVKRGFEFSLMVVGESGLGKSTLINSLFLTDLYKDRKLPTVQDNVNKTVEISKKSLEIEERGVKLRLTIVDTPGYNDAVNGEECWKNIIDYVDNQFEQYYQAESGLNRKNIQDTRVHCCLYFISPYGHGLKPMDVNFMKKLHKKCNIVPLVAKSDTLTPKEVKRLKLRILKEIEDNCIEIYQFPDCDSDEDDEFKEQDKALKAAIPFAVVGSNTVVEAGGKRIRGRMYPWGIVEVDNPSHCDFTKLRQMLISTHMQDLKDITSDVHYENYRAEHLASQMNKSQKERSKLKRDSVTNIESVVETEKLLQQKEAEIQRMQAMLAKMQAQLHGGSGQQVNGTVTNTQI